MSLIVSSLLLEANNQQLTTYSFTTVVPDHQVLYRLVSAAVCHPDVVSVDLSASPADVHLVYDPGQVLYPSRDVVPVSAGAVVRVSVPDAGLGQVFCPNQDRGDGLSADPVSVVPVAVYLSAKANGKPMLSQAVPNPNPFDATQGYSAKTYLLHPYFLLPGN